MSQCNAVSQTVYTWRLKYDPLHDQQGALFNNKSYWFVTWNMNSSWTINWAPSKWKKKKNPIIQLNESLPLIPEVQTVLLWMPDGAPFPL